MSVLSDAATALAVVAFAGWLARWISSRLCDALLAIANGLVSVADIAAGRATGAVFNGALCAYCAWRWWNGGGGDDTKRRLRRLAAKFKPVRRTAPQGA